MEADGKQTVLVVEDDILVRMHEVHILEDAGFAVIQVESADDALAILQQHDDVRLLLSDIDMSGSMDGLKLARRAHARWPSVSLLLTSGHQNVEEGTLPDHGRFVRKPRTKELPMSRIQATLDPIN